MWIWLCGIDIIDNKKRPTFKTQRERMQNEEEKIPQLFKQNNKIKINVLGVGKQRKEFVQLKYIMELLVMNHFETFLKIKHGIVKIDLFLNTSLSLKGFEKLSFKRLKSASFL